MLGWNTSQTSNIHDDCNFFDCPEIVCCDSDDIQVNVFASTDDEINTSPFGEIEANANSFCV